MSLPPDSALLPLGRCVVTSAAHDVLHPGDVQTALLRHQHGDWGELCGQDRQANHQALLSGSRIFSVYHDRGGVRFYIITEHDRSVTTVLLPEDY
mgnify:CR=1 FL=1